MIYYFTRFFLIIFMFTLSLRAQYVAAPTILINTPTVATLDRGAYITDARFTTNGGVLSGFQVGFTDRILIGLSYGGSQIIGNKEIHWNPDPGVMLKYHMVDETRVLPGMAAGFSTQGYGEFRTGHYEISPQGFYLVASKNWMFIGNTSLHAGVNYSLDQPGDTKIPSIFFGAAFELNPQFSLMLEYDAALNYENAADSLDFRISDGYGFLNAGIRVGITEHMFVELDFNNLIWNDKNENIESFNRELKIIFFDNF
ncbi:MAG: hypothetical protein KAI81_04645 [Candidatus Marinimicrobia bacterium]|nr:hypothetical protein [Candidatus Neomarinimicrobiota bacterium]